MRQLDEADIKKISDDSMARVGDIVRAAARVNVAQRAKSLGMEPSDLPKENIAKALEDEMGALLGRLVDNTIRVLRDVLDATNKPAAKKKARRAKK